MEENVKSPNNKLNDLIKVSIIIGILLISGSISYYFIYFLPQQEKDKANTIKLKEISLQLKEDERQLYLDGCLKDAEADDRSLRRANGKGTSLSMPLELSIALDKKYKDARDDCYKKYPPAKQ